MVVSRLTEPPLAESFPLQNSLPATLPTLPCTLPLHTQHATPRGSCFLLLVLLVHPFSLLAEDWRDWQGPA